MSPALVRSYQAVEGRDPRRTAMTFKVQEGTILLGKYRVEKELGHGAMGYVVSARHVSLGGLRAIKLLQPDALKNADVVKRFEREARACERLTSEHAMRVYDLGHLEDGSPVMVMEYLVGEDLQRVLDQRKRFRYDEAASYVLQACDAVAEAHELGIVHRDLKPSNLFLTRRPDGTACVKVLDFGISKSLDDATGYAPTLTATNTVMGTPYYMSPEQMRNSKATDARGDIWSLGVILYEFVTGRVPFDGDNFVDISSNAVFRQPIPPTQLCADIPSEIEKIILRCLEKNPDDRFPSVRDFMAALRPLAAVTIPHERVSVPGSSVPTIAQVDGDRTTIQHSESKGEAETLVAPAPRALESAATTATFKDPAQGPSTSHAQRFLRNHTEKLDAQRAKRRREIAIKVATVIAASVALIGSAILIQSEWPSLKSMISSLKAKGTSSSNEKPFPVEPPSVPDSAPLGAPSFPNVTASPKSKSTGLFNTAPKSSGVPSSSAGTPSSSAGAPSSSAGAPSSSTGAPSSSTGAPSSSAGAPSSSAGAPSSSAQSPPATSGTIIVVAAPGSCRVKIDNTPVGKTPIGPQKKAPGSYNVTCVKPDNTSITKSAVVKAGDVISILFP